MYDHRVNMQWSRNLSLKSLYFFPDITLFFPGSKYSFLAHHSVESIEKFKSVSLQQKYMFCITSKLLCFQCMCLISMELVSIPYYWTVKKVHKTTWKWKTNTMMGDVEGKGRAKWNCLLVSKQQERLKLSELSDPSWRKVRKCIAYIMWNFLRIITGKISFLYQQFHVFLIQVNILCPQWKLL